MVCWEAHYIGGICTQIDIDLGEKLKAILKWVPSTDKLFGYMWILCWFLAVWMYPIQLFISGLFCLFLAYAIFNKPATTVKSSLPALFVMDKNTRTLTVQELYENDMKWEDNEITSGDASLPTGSIKVGDVVTNCSGNLSLRHIPSNKLFGAYEFK